MMPPLMTVGSSPPASSNVATRDVVVVLPCVPATDTQDLKRISSASISARRTTGRRRSRAAISSGLSRLMAVETTTISAATSWSCSVLRGGCQLQDGLGQTLCGIGDARMLGSGSGAVQTFRVGKKILDLLGQAPGGEFGLWNDDGSPDIGQGRGIGRLILIEGAG